MDIEGIMKKLGYVKLERAIEVATEAMDDELRMHEDLEKAVPATSSLQRFGDMKVRGTVTMAKFAVIGTLRNKL